MAELKRFLSPVVAVLFAGIFVIQSLAQRQICSYFGSERTPKEAYSLSNCAWFRERSCCTRTEVTSAFLGMPRLESSSSNCSNHLNYMMCYFCSPNQFRWVQRGKVNICQSFCDGIYKHCKDAKFGGKALSSAYSSGNEFCKAQFFSVQDDDNDNCFKFDDSLFALASLHKVCWNMFAALLIISFSYYFSWT
ncbi:riboflavin-binding protein-like [Montipora capricornis]|uniref:riboflavin-binding protein-like n=1 Tax=Montipora capricornis TaxID=246305 RepID=UPI0035F205C4